MINQVFQDFQTYLSDHLIKVTNKYLDKVIQKFDYHFFTKNNPNNINPEKITKIMQRSTNKILFISEYIEKVQKGGIYYDFFILCFENNLLVIEQSEIQQFYTFFSMNPNLKIYTTYDKTLYKIEQALNQKLNCVTCEKNQQIFEEEISNFVKKFVINLEIHNQNIRQIKNLFKLFIAKPISGYLIIKSYNNTVDFDRFFHLSDFSTETKEIRMKSDEYITILQFLGGKKNVELIYHIELEELFVLKSYFDDNIDVLFNRERSNFLNIKHPFFPRYFGTDTDNKYKNIVIEYIQGKSIDEINKIELNEYYKIKIIFQILIGLEYLHRNGYIYRDLKPDNILIINEKYSICIIDFDRIIHDYDHYDTKEFCSDFIAPEILSDKKISCKADIYSVGKLINYLFLDELLSNSINNQYKLLKEMCEKCTNIDEDKRPNINELIKYFFTNFFSKKTIIDENDAVEMISDQHDLYIGFLFYISEQEHVISQFNLGLLHYYGLCDEIDNNMIGEILNFSLNNSKKTQYSYKSIMKLANIDKTIQYLTLASNQKHSQSQFILGLIYFTNKYLKQNIKNAIYYLALSANQDNLDAQFSLGNILYHGEYVKQDIKKAIFYLTLSAIKNNSDAQFLLGFIYYEGKYVAQDIIKAVRYFYFSAKQNNSNALYYLGFMYYTGIYIKQNINKAINYLSISSTLNNPDAQFLLGFIYYDGKYVSQDIKKAIYYLTPAANKNHLNAQYVLGLVYYLRENKVVDINKAIYYFSLASNQNHSYSQFLLGLIYYLGEFLPTDIRKSIYYLMLASNQNDSDAQFLLGTIYLKGYYIKQDLNQAFYYLTLAANQNHSEAQYNLGIIYYDGIYTEKNINKAIHYLRLSANQNNPDAQFYLGNIYYDGEYVAKNIKKAINYFFSSAENKNSLSQFIIGKFYLFGENIAKNVDKAIYYFTLSANIEAYFHLGSIFFKGDEVGRNIDKAIEYYKESSSYNDNYSKNNLGIIYKNIKKNTVALEYFEEAIRQKNDKVSMYNLAKIYFFGEFGIIDIDKSIDLFKESFNNGFPQARYLLCLAIFTKCNIFNYKNISNETINLDFNDTKTYKSYYKFTNPNSHSYYKNLYEVYKETDFVYDYLYEIVDFNKFLEKKEKEIDENKSNEQFNINKDFYDGFSINI